jgi:hypothetical protein
MYNPFHTDKYVAGILRYQERTQKILGSRLSVVLPVQST